MTEPPRRFHDHSRSGRSDKSKPRNEASDILTPLPSSSRPTQHRTTSSGPSNSPRQLLGISELMASPTIDYDFDYHHTRQQSRNSYFELPSRSGSDSYSIPDTPGSSESISSSTPSSSRPRIRNRNDGLAPHGSFTSVQVESLMTVCERLPLKVSSDDLSSEEVSELLEAARLGDQLALHRLEGRDGQRRRQRHSLGNAENVWGKSSASTGSRSSRASSHGSNFGANDRTLDFPDDRPNKTQEEPDLFKDVARMTLQSNARMNASNSRREEVRGK